MLKVITKRDMSKTVIVKGVRLRQFDSLRISKGKHEMIVFPLPVIITLSLKIIDEKFDTVVIQCEYRFTITRQAIGLRSFGVTQRRDDVIYDSNATNQNFTFATTCRKTEENVATTINNIENSARSACLSTFENIVVQYEADEQFKSLPESMMIKGSAMWKIWMRQQEKEKGIKIDINEKEQSREADF